jgi:hypothetical protein
MSTDTRSPWVKQRIANPLPACSPNDYLLGSGGGGRPFPSHVGRPKLLCGEIFVGKKGTFVMGVVENFERGSTFWRDHETLLTPSPVLGGGRGFLA